MSCLKVSGPVIGKRVGVFQGREFCTLQFLGEGMTGEAQFIEVSLPDGADHSTYVKGKEVELPVIVRARDNRVFYRAVPPAAAQAARPAAK